jgi:hypothetical protein
MSGSFDLGAKGKAGNPLLHRQAWQQVIHSLSLFRRSVRCRPAMRNNDKWALRTTYLDTEGHTGRQRRVPRMKIHLRVFQSPVHNVELPGPAGPGKQFVFSDDLVLERIDNEIPENGLPKLEKDRRVGTQSGLLTVLRIAAGNDAFYPKNSLLIQYQGTYKFNALTGTPLRKGEVTARGLLFLDKNHKPLEPVTFAITGGTGAYETARGQITEGVPGPDNRLLDIQL